MSQGLPLCPLSVDDSFGPWAGECRGGFDFTLLFEESILAIPVSCIFLLVLPFRMLQLAGTEKKVKSSALRLYKAVRIPFKPQPYSSTAIRTLTLQKFFSSPQLIWQSFSCCFLSSGLLPHLTQSLTLARQFRLRR
jgi:hypothetical protein